MPMQRPRSGDLQENKEEWDDVNNRDVLCTTPYFGYKQPKPGRNPVHLSKRTSSHSRPTCPSDGQRATEVFRRHEEWRLAARQLLQSSPVPSSPSPRSLLRSRLQGEFDYSSDFTEDEEDTWGRGTVVSHRVVANETSSGEEEALTSHDGEIRLLMMKKDKRVRRKTPSVGEPGRQNRGDSGHTGRKAKAFDAASQGKPCDTDGRHFNLPHDRPLDPWKLPPIDNLTKKGPVNLVLNPATNPDQIRGSLPTTSISDQMLTKALLAKARKLRKLERRQKKRKYHERN